MIVVSLCISSPSEVFGSLSSSHKQGFFSAPWAPTKPQQKPSEIFLYNSVFNSICKKKKKKGKKVNDINRGYFGVVLAYLISLKKKKKARGIKGKGGWESLKANYSIKIIQELCSGLCQSPNFVLMHESKLPRGQACDYQTPLLRLTVPVEFQNVVSVLRPQPHPII